MFFDLSKKMIFFFFFTQFVFYPKIYGDDFVVDAPTTQQNGGDTIDGNDSLTVTKSGVISTLSGIDAVSTSGSNNLIDNKGEIIGGKDGIVLNNGSNTVINSGMIKMDTATTSGIVSLGESSTIKNKGDIISSRHSTIGVFLQDNLNSSFINSGEIILSGIGTVGVRSVSTNAVIINTGEIIVSKFDSQAIILGETNLASNNIVTNSGKIVSERSYSLWFQSDNNVLNLLAPSFIGGAINLEAPTTVTVQTGRSHSVLWDFSTGSIEGGVLDVSGSIPYFYDTNLQKFATFDPSALSTAPDFLADVSFGACHVVQNRLMHTFRCTPKCFCVTPWISVYKSRFDYEKNSEILKRDVNYSNVLIGAEMVLPCEMTAGVLTGYGKGHIEASSTFYRSFKNDVDGFIGGGYLRKIWDCYFVHVILSGGNLDFDDERYVNDNLAYLGEAVPAEGDYNSWWMSPEVMTGAFINFRCGTSLIPNISYRYAYQNIEKYQEKGSTENATVHSRDVQVGELKVELLAKQQINVFDFAVKGGYLLRNPLGCNDTKVTLLGQTKTMPFFGNDHSCGYVGANATFSLPYGFELCLDGEFVSGYKMQGGSGVANLSLHF